jgi:hypothetical protein
MYQYHITHNVCKKIKQTAPVDHMEQTKQVNHIDPVEQDGKTDPLDHNKTKLKLVLKRQYQNINVDELINQLSETKEKLSATEEKLSEMVGKYDSLKENPQNVTNNTQQINLFFPTAFGQENIKNILDKLPSLLNDAITKHCDRSVAYLTEKIHCNKEMFPEYTNVYISNYKSPFALVSDGARFKHKSKKSIIDEIIERSLHMLQTYVDNSDLTQKIFNKYERYQNLIEVGQDEKKSEERKELEIEIAGMLLDMRDVIGSDPRIKSMLNDLEEGKF